MCAIAAESLQPLDTIIHPRNDCIVTVTSATLSGDVTLKFIDAPMLHVPRGTMITLVVSPLRRRTL